MRVVCRIAVALCATAFLGGCAGTGGGDQVVAEPTPAPGEPAGATGAFVALDGRPEGYDNVEGTATVTVDDGTSATIELSGLRPNTAYVAHVHEQPCSLDDGGAHFRFDPDGGERPPNEVHLRFTTDEDGSGTARATNDRDLPIDQALSVVVHEEPGNEHGHGTTEAKIACADLS